MIETADGRDAYRMYINGDFVDSESGGTIELPEQGATLRILVKPVKREDLESYGHVELAITHGAPVVPVAVIGAEEQWPQVARIDSIQLFGAPWVPMPRRLPCGLSEDGARHAAVRTARRSGGSRPPTSSKGSTCPWPGGSPSSSPRPRSRELSW